MLLNDAAALLQVVAYDSSPSSGRVGVLTEQRLHGRETRSHLVIRDARPAFDSGNYTCKPSIARAASVKVHVLESKYYRSRSKGKCTNESLIIVYSYVSVRSVRMCNHIGLD
jgi:hypothetical protein